ncbi:MAG TPA: hypothetical protein VFD03_07270 [Clostridia bacterium]|nr:hypothetical protein [Clostridia bacterium]
MGRLIDWEAKGLKRPNNNINFGIGNLRKQKATGYKLLKQLIVIWGHVNMMLMILTRAK